MESRCVLARENRGAFTAVYIAKVRITVAAEGTTIIREGHVDLSNGVVTALSEEKTDWRITLVDTGATALTGARVKRAAKFIEDDKFFATYGDGVSNIDIGKLLEFHNAEGRKATVTAVRPPSRFGELLLEEGVVRSFVEKPQTGAGWINGGFFVFDTAAVRALPDNEDLSLESHAQSRRHRSQIASMQYRER